MLLKALEDAILGHAKKDTNWWHLNRKQLCCSREAALRYIVILALTESPERNIAEVTSLLTDPDMMASSLRYELGTLIHASFIYLDATIQDTIQATILSLWNDKRIDENAWILRWRAELLSVIPSHLRSPETQKTLLLWEKSSGPCIRQPHINSHGGWVIAPFSYERFLEFTDATVLKILAHYTIENGCNWSEDFLVSGANEVEWQLREASSRSPIRFMRLLAERWADIPNRFSDDIIDGAATYLAYRYGNLQVDANQWKPVEEPDPQDLAVLLLDEIERHPLHWHHCRIAAKALEACANVIESERDASRLLFIALDFINLQEELNTVIETSLMLESTRSAAM